LNDVLKGTVTNSQYQSGKLRLGNNARGFQFKNLQVLRAQLPTQWQTVKIEATDDGKVKYYLDGSLKHTISDNKYKFGKLRLGNNCRAVQFKDLRVLRALPSTKWQTVRINAAVDGTVSYYLDGEHRYSVSDGKYQYGKLRLGNNCRAFQFRNVRVLRNRASSDYQTLRINAAADGKVYYYLDGKLKHQVSDASLKSGKIRLGNNCRNFQYKNLRIRRQYPTKNWQTVRIRADTNGTVNYWLNGKLKASIQDNKYTHGKIRFGNNCGAKWQYKNLMVWREHYNQSLCHVPPMTLRGEVSSAHQWREAWEGPSKFVCGKIDDNAFDAEIKSYNGVPSNKYEFEIVTAGKQPALPHHHRGWDGGNEGNGGLAISDGNYSAIMRADCRVFGMSPVCDHPRFCKNDPNALYIGNDYHLSYPGHKLLPSEDSDGTRLTGFNRFDKKAKLAHRYHQEVDPTGLNGGLNPA